MNRKYIYKFLPYFLILISNLAQSKYRPERFVQPFTKVPAGTLQWVVQINNQFGRWCTAMLISDRHVLTSAHCLLPEEETKNLKIEFVNTKNRFIKRAIRYIIHPDYFDPDSATDIAIIELESPVHTIRTPNADFNSICPGYLSNIQNPMVAGYGGGTLLKLIDLSWDKHCINKELRTSYAGVAQGGDSGSPLFYDFKNETNVLGVLSANRFYPDNTNRLIFMSLSWQKQFINDHIQLSKTYNLERSKYYISGRSLNIGNWTEISGALFTSANKIIYLVSGTVLFINLQF
ncbi:trypsin-like serine protease [Endozoicomonas gorgoniicola]|uniref:Trypsin-like serine protease n=1 Tax=Endozoicomonas gorgoniicola TaxID=1234144 RepID=A0ABT3N1G7_9GAMM|nr:trypsin-like serine protease [Endozoicomonas gorgoniicola]MCW7555472.1 trypsin-like serine protease [Endozoicomonas gorgoniicola]